VAWHIVQTAPCREKRVAADIERLGLKVYCPLEPHRVRVNPYRHRTAMRPMLPGYLFTAFDVERDHWQAICKIRYARKIFMIDYRPVPLPDPIIEQIAAKEREQLAQMGRRPRRHMFFRFGQVARAKIGPFLGFFGQVVDLKQNTVCVEFSLFGRATRAWLRDDQLEGL
jgi:transcription antitermination factor NusG